jgi:hypothetical protein
MLSNLLACGGGTPLPPTPEGMSRRIVRWRVLGLCTLTIAAQKFEILYNYTVGYWERVKDFFEHPPSHNLKVGDLVTCTCHGGVAIVTELYDNPAEIEYPKMNMAKIWWIRRAHSDQPRVWLHTIGRLNKYSLFAGTWKT